MALKRRNNIFLGVICVAISMVILFFGLWPLSFHPENEVEWLKQDAGINFYGSGVVYSLEPVNIPEESHAGNELSIEIWLKPDTDALIRENYLHLAQVFSLYDHSKKSNILAFYQWQSTLIVHSLQRDFKEYNKVGLQGALVQDKSTFITVTSAPEGTTIYIDGKEEQHYQNYSLITTGGGVAGQVVLGNSSTGTHAWNGDLLGLAIYNQRLSPEEVYRHYREWVQDGYPAPAEGERPVVIYTFKAKEGRSVSNTAGPGPDLFIPATFSALQKKVLVLPWENFHLTLSYMQDVILNVLGFVPLGFFVSAFLNKTGMKTGYRLFIITVILGIFISLVIELTQVYIPARVSSLTDLICNAAGTLIGVVIFQYLLPGRKPDTRVSNF